MIAPHTCTDHKYKLKILGHVTVMSYVIVCTHPQGHTLYLPLGDMSLSLLHSAISVLDEIELAVTRSAVPVSRSVNPLPTIRNG